MTDQSPRLGGRLACILYESLVVFSIILIGFLIPQAVFSGFGLIFSGKLMWLHVFLLLMPYFVWCWTKSGQTLPMKTWKLRIANPDGSQLRPTQALLRYLAAWPSVVIFGLGLFWALIDKDGQYLHDRIAGTRIVRADR